MSESLQLLNNMGTARPQVAVDDAVMKTPEVKEFNGSSARTNILHHKAIQEKGSREVVSCERVVSILTPTPPGVDSGEQTADGTSNAIGKTQENYGGIIGRPKGNHRILQENKRKP